jgi:hypothetical protein
MKYLKSFLTMGCIAAMVWGLSGCKEDDPGSEEVTLQSINVTPATVSVIEGATQQLTVTLVPEGVPGVTISYQSASAAVATVSTSGEITAVAAGGTTITVSAATQNGTPVTKAVPVTVLPANTPLQSISVEPATVTLLLETASATQQLAVTTVPAGLADVTYTYVSAHPAIATVSTSGLVEAVTVGETTITVTGTAPDGSQATATVPVTVDYDIAPFNRSAWTGEANSVIDPGSTAVEKMFDGDLESMWHSANPGIPAIFTVDMKGDKRIDGFYYYNRQNLFGNDRQYPKDLSIETSRNGTDWTTVYTTTSAVMKNLRVALPLQSQVIARYFKVTITSTAYGEPYTYFAEFGAYNAAEPLSTPLNIALNAPAADLIHSPSNPLTFAWEADDPAPANYTLKLSKNANLSSATEYTVTGTSREVTAAELSALLGADGVATIYWTVSAANATQPAARTFTLDGRTFELIEGKLVNAKRPFTTEETGHWWTTGERLMRLTGWTHEGSQISWSNRDNENPEGFICIWAYPPADLPWASNNKVYQTVHLDAGDYKLEFHLHTKAGGELSAYGVVTTAAALPNHDDVTSDANVLGYDHLSDYQSQDRPVLFTVPAGGSNVTIGWVYNTWDVGHPLVSYRMLGLDLYGLR